MNKFSSENNSAENPHFRPEDEIAAHNRKLCILKNRVCENKKWTIRMGNEDYEKQKPRGS